MMKTGRFVTVLAFVVLFLVSLAGHSEANLGICDEITLPAELGALALDSAAFGNGRFVAAGSSNNSVPSKGAIISSPAGKNWVLGSSGESDALRGVAYGNGTFVAVGDYGSVLTSPDGMNWTVRVTKSFYQLKGITYGNGMFVAVGDYGLILTSPDGVNWIDRFAGTIGSLKGVTYGDGLFVAVGTNGAVVTSFDGINWSAGGISGIPDYYDLTGVAYGNGTFVSIGDVFGYPGLLSSYSIVVTSPDGVNWTSVKSGGYYYGVAFGNGTFVIAGVANYGIILTSPDGKMWTTRATDSTFSPWAISFGNNTFIAVGGYTGVSTILQCDPLSDQPFPQIKANQYISSSPNGLQFTANDVLSITVSLEAVGLYGVDADWWIVADTPFGLYYYGYPTWTYAADINDVRPVYQGPLFSFSPVEVLNISGLGTGSYTFYFGIDTDMNGRIDWDKLYVDAVELNIVQ
ncbi:MAG: hypothetical protein P8Z71_08070 [Candidatus Sulfobium sp.]